MMSGSHAPDGARSGSWKTLVKRLSKFTTTTGDCPNGTYSAAELLPHVPALKHRRCWFCSLGAVAAELLPLMLAAMLSPSDSAPSPGGSSAPVGFDAAEAQMLREDIIFQMADCVSCRSNFALAAARVVQSFDIDSISEMSDMAESASEAGASSISPEDLFWFQQSMKASLAIMHVQSSFKRLYPDLSFIPRHLPSGKDCAAEFFALLVHHGDDPFANSAGCGSVVSAAARLRYDSFPPPGSSDEHVDMFGGIQEYAFSMRNLLVSSMASKAASVAGKLETVCDSARRNNYETSRWTPDESMGDCSPSKNINIMFIWRTYSEQVFRSETAVNNLQLEESTSGARRPPARIFSSVQVLVPGGTLRDGDLAFLQARRGEYRDGFHFQLPKRIPALFVKVEDDPDVMSLTHPDNEEARSFARSCSNDVVFSVEEDDDTFAETGRGETRMTGGVVSLRLVTCLTQSQVLQIVSPNIGHTQDPEGYVFSFQRVENFCPEFRSFKAISRVQSTMPSFPLGMTNIFLNPHAASHMAWLQALDLGSRAHFEDNSTDTTCDSRWSRLNFNPSQLRILEHVRNVRQRVLNGVPCCSDHLDAVTLIQGPPGTGKTSLIIEILHLLVAQQDSTTGTAGSCTSAIDGIPRVLVCTQGNAALDSLLLRFADMAAPASHSHDGPIMSHDLLFSRIGKASDEKAVRYEAAEVGRSKTHGTTCWTARQVVARSHIVFSTLSGAGNSILASEFFSFLVVDEACTATEIDLLIPLTRPACEKEPVRAMFLVGDPKQLPPYVDWAMQNQHPQRAKQLARSFFERIGECFYGESKAEEGWILSQKKELEGTLLEKFRKKLSPSFPAPEQYLLNIQYRMHPVLSEFISTTFYDSKVQDGVTSEDRSAEWHRHQAPRRSPLSGINGIFGPLCFLDVDEYAKKWAKVYAGRPSRQPYVDRIGTGTSIFVNEDEVSFVTELVVRYNEFLEEKIHQEQSSETEIGKTIDIAIISPYTDQVERIRFELENSCLEDNRKISEGPCTLSFETGDGMQGKEAQVVIISTVNRNRTGAIGFLQDSRRACVLFSRAKQSLIVVGSLATAEAKDNVLSLFVKHCKSKGVVGVPTFHR